VACGLLQSVAFTTPWATEAPRVRQPAERFASLPLLSNLSMDPTAATVSMTTPDLYRCAVSAAGVSEQGDHSLSRYTHRLAFFQALEAFLDENLRPVPRPATGI
jgi:hypothetical protein